MATLAGQETTLPADLARETERIQAAWQRDGSTARLWARDAGLWTGKDEARWLGWLDIAARMRARVDEFSRLGEEVRREGFSHALLIGMGGSSLGPEVLAETFGPQAGFPELLVLDSTDPAQIRAFERRIDPARTLYIVSSKSGTTLEPNILMRYFLAYATEALGADRAAQRFVAITDPGSALEKEAARRGFRRVFLGEPSIGGRYSVLSAFGLAPAAAMGLDVPRLLDAAERMMQACGAGVPPAADPGVALGILLGAAANAGRDKVTIAASPALADFGAWLEQLIAESTGKNGTGIVPVDDEPLGPPEVYGRDRVFVHLGLAGEADAAAADRIARLADAGHPVVRIALEDRYQIGGEFFRWEIATAVAGAVIGVNPFDQPDVEASKVKTRALTAAVERDGGLPPEQPLLEEGGLRLFADPRNAAALAAAARERTLIGFLRAHLTRLGAGDYCAILAYLARDPTTIAKFRALRTMIRDEKQVATCVGFGPRFLHSTGQAYKGGPGSGLFLQITCEAREDLPVPGQAYGFGVVEAAQARGDFEVLAERGRRALRIDLGADPDAGLATLEAALRGALG